MTTFALPQHVIERQQLRALARRPQPCGICSAWTKTVLYPCGYRCRPCTDSAGLVPVHGQPGVYPQFLRDRRAGTASAQGECDVSAAPDLFTGDGGTP